MRDFYKILTGILVVFIFLLLITSVFTVDSGERTVVLRFGDVNRIADEGLHWKIPFVESKKTFSVRTQKMERSASSASKDLQIVTTQIALNYNIDPKVVDRLYTTVGKSYESQIIDPAIQDAVKAATAQFNAEALITKRAEVKEVMENDLRERMQKAGLIVTAMNIVDFTFSEEFDQAIEAKVTAEQNALKAQNDLAKVEFEAQQKIEQAKAEAEAIRIQAQAITQQGGKDFVQLRAIEKWDGKLPTQFVPNSAVPFLNI